MCAKDGNGYLRNWALLSLHGVLTLCLAAGAGADVESEQTAELVAGHARRAHDGDRRAPRRAAAREAGDAAAAPGGGGVRERVVRQCAVGGGGVGNCWMRRRGQGRCVRGAPSVWGWGRSWACGWHQGVPKRLAKKKCGLSLFTLVAIAIHCAEKRPPGIHCVVRSAS